MIPPAGRTWRVFPVAKACPLSVMACFGLALTVSGDTEACCSKGGIVQ